jgi:hypothetical protein
MRSPRFILCGLLLRNLLIHSDAEFHFMREPTARRLDSYGASHSRHSTKPTCDYAGGDLHRRRFGSEQIAHDLEEFRR